VTDGAEQLKERVRKELDPHRGKCLDNEEEFEAVVDAVVGLIKEDRDALPETLEQAKARTRLAAIQPGGTNCPLCTKHVQIYQRSVSSGSARMLIAVYRWHRRGEEVISSDKISELGWTGSSDYAKMRWWGLMEPVGQQRTKDQNSSGLWKLTDKGIAFVQDRVTIRKYVREYRSSPLGEPYGEEVGIRDALRNKFDYAALING
jgi:hypothetical protein